LPDTPAESSGNAAAPESRPPIRATIVAALVGAACGIAWYLLPLPPPTPADSARFPGLLSHLHIEDVDVATTDSSGRMHRRLQAKELRRDVPGGKSFLVQPRLTVFSEGEALWHFASERGEVSPDGENIYLPGPVRGRRGPVQPIEIESADVRIMAAESYGESDQPSTIRGRAFQARGDGLKIWLDEGKVELVNDARGTLQKR